jgi:hypothetical protein
MVLALLEIRPPHPKTTGGTMEDREMENFLSKAKFTSSEECTSTQAQQT